MLNPLEQAFGQSGVMLGTGPSFSQERYVPDTAEAALQPPGHVDPSWLYLIAERAGPRV